MFGNTMFKITAKNCKEWADKVNYASYDILLTEIATAARAGKYALTVKTLSKKFNTKLLDDGFVVSKNISHSGRDDSYLIIWA